MPVSYPPPTVPQVADIATLRGHSTEIIRFRAEGLQFHLSGAPVLSPAELAELIAEIQADTRVNPVFRTARTISLAYRDAGYPAAQVLYATEGREVYLLATTGPLTRVEAEAPMRAYFDHLEGATVPREDDIRRPHSLASLHAERIGTNLAGHFAPDPDPAATPGAQMLQFQVLSEDEQRAHYSASFGNPGNRFVGRYFSTFSARYDWVSGDEVGVQWIHGWNDLEENAKGEDQEDFKLSWDRVTPFGVFGVSGRRTDYALNGLSERRSIGLFGIDIPLLGQSAGAAIDGDIRELAVEWLYPLQVTSAYRWTINTRLDYSSQRTTATQADAGPNPGAKTRLQDQEVAGIEVGTGYSFRLFEAVLPLAIDAHLAVRKGLGKDRRDNPLIAADQSYWLARPKIAITTELNESWSAQMTGFAQIASATLPQHDQWVLGGAEALYAYVPGVVIGDSGALVGGKLIYQGLPPVWGVDLKLYGLAEYGVANADAEGSFLRGRGLQSVADAGAMIRAQFLPYLQASLSFARGFADHNINRITLNNTRADFYFRVEINL